MTTTDIGYLITGAFLAGTVAGILAHWWIRGGDQVIDHAACNVKVQGAENRADLWEGKYKTAVREKAKAELDADGFRKAYAHTASRLVTAQYDAEQYEAAWRAELADHEDTRERAGLAKVYTLGGGA